jgi:hypothetical protein
MRLVGFSETVGPAGEEEAMSETEPLNPLRLATVIVDVFDEPCTTESEDGEAETLKSGVDEA